MGINPPFTYNWRIFVIDLKVESQMEESNLLLQNNASAVNGQEVLTYIAREGMSLYPGLLLNTFRDFTWTIFSFDDYSDRIKTVHSWDQQTYGQWLWATLPMLAVTAAAGLIFAAKKESHVSWKEWFTDPEQSRLLDFIKSTAGASLAIPAWDLGQRIGINLGQHYLNLSPISAGYFACLFTGLFEGLVQYLTPKLIEAFMIALTDPSVQAKWYHDKAGAVNEAFGSALKAIAAALFSRDLIYNGTIGAVPGAVWQIVFVAAVAAGWTQIPTAAAVMAGVATANALVPSAIKFADYTVKNTFAFFANDCGLNSAHAGHDETPQP